MRFSLTSWVPRLAAVAAATVVLLTGLAGLARADGAEVTVTASPPIVSIGDQDGGPAGITDQASVSATIQADAATALTCTLDDQSVACGTPPPTCAATICDEFAASGLGQGDHELSVQGADGSFASYDFDIDQTPPDTGLLALNHDLDINPLRPQFSFSVLDDNDASLGETPPYTLDSAQCAMTVVGAPPSWTTCAQYLPDGDFGGFKYRPTLPAKHIDYDFEARGLDPLGRVDPTPVHMLYDPMPCGVAVRAPTTKRDLLAVGVPVTLDCNGQLAVRLYLLLVEKNGRHVRQQLPLGGPVPLATPPGSHSYRRRLRVQAPLLLNGARTYTVEVTALSELLAGSASFTITAPAGHGQARRTHPRRAAASPGSRVHFARRRCQSAASAAVAS